MSSSTGDAARILVVEDEPTINQAVTDRLRAEGFIVDQAYDGPGAVAAFGQQRPDLVVLDVMLPGFDGLEVCRRIQAIRPVPVLMLTARSDETDLLVGLGVGADDYVTKPFSMREVVARIRALLRRVERAAALAASGAGTIELPGLVIDPATRRVTVDGRSGAPDSPRVRPAVRTGRAIRARCAAGTPSCWRSGGGRTPLARAPWTAT